MSRTSFLAAIALLVLALQVFPNQAGTIKLAAIALAILYFGIRALRVYPQRYRAKKKRAAQEAADRQEYRRYETELNAIRSKYAPITDLGENAVVPQEYRDELSALHDRHRAMLDRKFGPG